MLRFKDMFPYGIEYRPGEDELTNYRALRRKRTIGVGEGGPVGEAHVADMDKYFQSGKHEKGVSVGYPYKHKKLKNRQVVHQYTGEQTEEDVDEALSVQQRLVKARNLRKNKAKIAMGKRRAARRFASKETLERRARRAAYKQFYKKITKNIPRSELSPARKAEIEKRLNKPVFKNKIERVAKKMLKDVRKKEMQRKRG